MSRRTGLGRGLDALIPGGGSSSPPEDRIIEVDIIVPNPRQPRGNIKQEELNELASSIQEHGILQPLIVTKDETSGKYTLIAGERRLEAAKLAGLARVPVIVREVSEQQRLELAIIENVQRSDLNPMEAANAYRQLVDDFGLSHDEISSRVGKSRVSITNTLRLQKLSDSVQKALVENQISEGHARALLALPTHPAQNAALQTILTKDLNVRQTEDLVRKLGGQKKDAPAVIEAPPPELLALEDQLRKRLGTRVNINQRKNGGAIVIQFYSTEELNAIIGALLGDN